MSSFPPRVERSMIAAKKGAQAGGSTAVVRRMKNPPNGVRTRQIVALRPGDV